MDAERTDFETKVLPRSSGRNVLDLIRTHAGSGNCQNCGHTDSGDGSIGLVDLLLDGEPVEALALVREIEDSDDLDVTPIALVVTESVAARLSKGGGDEGDVSPGA